MATIPRTLVFQLALALMLALPGCLVQPPPPQNNSTSGNGSGMPNPASLYCAEHGGTLSIAGGGGGQHGVCMFPGGAKCDEWALYRGECSAEAPNYCEADSDCSCGVHAETGGCFYGQKEFVDEDEQCPDFCTGIAAHLEIRCVQNQCKQQMKSRCAGFGVDDCPAGCRVCPPCAECSSISCQSEEYCESIGFGAGWYNSTLNRK